jgi:hypothetical protein
MFILKLLLGSMLFFISYKITLNGFDIPIQTLGNMGATGYIFI